jgi:hypothetical protein
VRAGHELVVDTAATEHVAQVGEVVVAAFMERFGDRSPARLLEELDLDQDQVVEDLVRLAPGVVDALRGTGDLERLVRSRLEPFWASERVATILSENS